MRWELIGEIDVKLFLFMDYVFDRLHPKFLLTDSACPSPSPSASKRVHNCPTVPTACSSVANYPVGVLARLHITIISCVVSTPSLAMTNFQRQQEAQAPLLISYSLYSILIDSI
jgi:hypothetical protein